MRTRHATAQRSVTCYCPGPEMRSQYRPIASMIWSAVLVHLKGLALSFQNLIHCSSAQVSSSIEQKTPRSRRRRCSSANHRSTWLSHDEYVGEMQLEPRVLHQPPLDRRSLVHGEVVADQVDRQAGLDGVVDPVEEVCEVPGRVPGGGFPGHRAGGDVQRGEQVHGTVPLVVVTAPLRGAGDHRQYRGGP